jgi:predicted RNA-binding protein YlxR (DUF448 family)
VNVSNERRARVKKESVRTCCACRKTAPPAELIRWVRAETGDVIPDLVGSSFGRGAWTHPHHECLKKLQTSLARSFKAPVLTSTMVALELLSQAGEHRAGQLLGVARRRGLLVHGSDACSEAWSRGGIHLLLVARDAQAAAKLGFVSDAIASGQAQAWSSKEAFGRLLGRSEVALVGLQDRGLARSLFGAIAMALLVRDPALNG